MSWLSGLTSSGKKLKSAVLAAAISLTGFSPGCPAADHSELQGIVLEYDTIVLGRVKKVAANPKPESASADRYIVVVGNLEVLKGAALPREIAIYIHSPAQEFPLYDHVRLKGRRCVWALKVRDEKIAAARAVFPGQIFEEEDLRKLKEEIARKSPPGAPAVPGPRIKPTEPASGTESGEINLR